jgi:outer membrane protein OmpA-like peptidoglycan-associated protein
MRLRSSSLAIALLGACAGSHPAPSPSVVSAELGIFRAAELARVRCLVVAPFENASSAPLAAAAATSSLLSGISASGTRVFPVSELRALFRDTPVELPEGIPPGLAMELAQLVGADAAVYGTVEGFAEGADPGLVVSVRLALSPRRELLYASTFAVKTRPGETIESAVRRSLSDATHEMFLRLGGFRGASCFDRKRLESLRALALAGEGSVKPAALPAPAPPPVAAPVQPPPAAALPTVAAPAKGAGPVPPPRPATTTPRQKEWAQELGAHEPFLVDDVAFAGRTPQLQRDGGLADLAIAILATPEVRVRIEGHVDATNDAAADARLSMDMAKAASDRLAELGVPAGRVLVAGRGADNPRLPNFTARGRATNRRIEAVGLK